MIQKRPPYAGPRSNAPSNNAGPRNASPSARQYKETPEHRQAKLEDLRMTLGHRDGQALADNNLLTFHEKVDNIMEEQE